jgi:general secretion pathway protein G
MRRARARRVIVTTLYRAQRGTGWPVVPSEVAITRQPRATAMTNDGTERTSALQAGLTPRPKRRLGCVWVLVAIVVASLLVGLFGKPRWCSLGCQESGDTVRMQMGLISDAIDSYRATRRTIPRSLDDLTEPSERTQEPYFDRIPLDPWGQPFAYRVLDERKGAFELRSGGEDRTIGTGDDVVVRERDVK